LLGHDGVLLQWKGSRSINSGYDTRFRSRPFAFDPHSCISPQSGGTPVYGSAGNRIGEIERLKINTLTEKLVEPS
jgi:hypothetical protein